MGNVGYKTDRKVISSTYRKDKDYEVLSKNIHDDRGRCLGRICHRRPVCRRAGIGAAALAAQSDRDYWLSVLTRISEPVLVALSQRKLVELMPVDTPMGSDLRKHFAYLEAIGDVIGGIGSWLESRRQDRPRGKTPRALLRAFPPGHRRVRGPRLSRLHELHPQRL